MKNADSQFSFARKYRLTTKADYTAVFNDQQKICSGWFLALYKKNQQTYARLGLIVGKHIVRKATARNVVKRAIREGFRVRKSQMKGFDIIIMARKGCKPADSTRLQKELDTLWQGLSKASSSLSGDTDIS